MSATLKNDLDLTRRVFAGEVTRTELAYRTAREIAFVGIAIMLAVREPYLDDDNTVRGAYGHVLEALLSHGAINKDTSSRRYKYGATLVGASLAAGLHRSGTGKSKVLTPPPELVALVAELGRTPAIEAFVEAVKAGAKQEQEWRQERSQSGDVWMAIRGIETRYGIDGLHELLARLNKRLAE